MILQSRLGRGVSLIEFLIYTGLVIVVVGAATIFAINQLHTNRAVQQTADAYDNARAMLEQIGRDVQLADPSSLQLGFAYPFSSPCTYQNLAAWGAAGSNVAPCLRFTQVATVSGVGASGQTITYYFNGTDIMKQAGSGAPQKVNHRKVEYFGFLVYYSKNTLGGNIRVTLLLDVKPPTQTPQPAAPDTVFQRTVFLNQAYEVIPPQAP